MTPLILSDDFVDNISRISTWREDPRFPRLFSLRACVLPIGIREVAARGFEINLSFIAEHTEILKFTASILLVLAESPGKRDSMRPCFDEIDSLPLPMV